VTEWVYNGDGDEKPVIEPESGGSRGFSTKVERDESGHWLAVVTLGDGASVSKVFDTEGDAVHYGDELAEWLSARREHD
jgi:hypothetical protein